MAALEAGLHGPARARARLLRELRDGLTDTVDALVREGVPADRAAREAVREFGTPEELLPGCQRELTLAQARRTARIVALTAPLFLLACGLLVRAAGHGGPWPQGLPAVLAAAAALPAGAALAATGGLARRWPVPRWLPLAVAWTGRATALGMALAAPALGLAALPSAEGLPLAAAGGLAVVAHAVVAPSARACRRCARLPAALP
ncbi:permease prefix domain 1-containing protein [Streptomyces sp. JJ36]|uniref:permease prefix domain 1-containing protein n=1 Tax=Streptomyces sp. JJ36 TaxID=2736645 RepID=UPI001F1FCD83|nr:permease prefix domain 1-containing protein [Streptomyces sp. JJ36]MCF6522647.1 hypothetical protein [Streptomyces sp. JJ36]